MSKSTELFITERLNSLPTEEEYKAQQLKQIHERWLSLRRDLQHLCEGGTLSETMTLTQVFETLAAGPKE